MEVRVRKLKIEDALISYKWRNDPEIWKYTGSKPDSIITEDIEKAWIEKVLCNKNELRFAIVADDVYVGNTYLTDMRQKKAQFHIFIGDKSYWGQGIGDRVVKLMLEEAKKNKLEKIWLEVNKQNEAAKKIYLKNGFRTTNETEVSITMEKSVGDAYEQTV